MSLPSKAPHEVALLHSYHPDVIESAEEVYDELHSGILRDSVREEIFMHGVCSWASELLVDRMAERGYKLHLFESDTADDYEWLEHVYTGVRSTRGLIILDPTWVQYLDPTAGGTPLEAVNHLPKVLVGTRAEVAKTAKIAGLDDYQLRLWQRDYSRVSTHRDYHESLAAFFASRGV